MIMYLMPMLWFAQSNLFHNSNAASVDVGVNADKDGVTYSGPPLRPYNEVPQTHKLKAGIDKTARLDMPLHMFCSASEESTAITSCQWHSPDGHKYKIESGIVTEEEVNGTVSVLSTITTNNSFSHSCSITIKNLLESQFGIWNCIVRLKGVEQFQSAYLTATSELRVKDVRLPRYITPKNYTLYLTPFLIENNFTFHGHVDILARVSSKEDVIGHSTKNITLHINALTIFENLVRVEGYNIIGHGYDAARKFYIIYLDRDLEPDSETTISIDFSGNLTEGLAGFYRSTYEDSDGNNRYIATTQFESTSARKAFPCFDEPNMKATFQINLGRTNEMSSLSNMPVKEKCKPMADNENYCWDMYEETPRMSTYLLAFIVSDFVAKTSAQCDSNLCLKIWSKDSAFKQTGYAADIGPKILAYFQEYFNVDYPLPKMDMIAIPDFSAGAMENWGLITYRETYLLYMDGVSSQSDKISVAEVVSHELAHQWFGNLVTMEWWDDIWLNEGFADYSSYIGVNHVEPDAEIMGMFILNEVQSVFVQDALESSHPISISVGNPDEINELFDSISYKKAASVIRMAVSFLGDNTFKKGITNYLNKFQYENANQDNLWDYLNKAAVADKSLPGYLTVKMIMDTWTLQKGYPVISVKINETNLILEQTRFLLYHDDVTKEDEHNYRWWVPITYTVAGGDFSTINTQVWMNPNEMEPKVVDIGEDFEESKQTLILNVQETGYYRINYEKSHLYKLRESLLKDVNSIHRINRAQILDDAFNLARAGLLDYYTMLNMTDYLEGETDYIPWKAALNGFSYMKMMLRRKGSYGNFKKLMISQLVPLYEKFGFESKPNDKHLDMLLRDDVVDHLCIYDYKPCKTIALDQFSKWLKTPDPHINNEIEPNRRVIVYCSGIAEGSIEEWDFLFEQMIMANNANEKIKIMKALTCSQEIWILQRYLDMLVDPTSGIRYQDSATVINNIAKNPIGRDVVWDWLRSEWGKIVSYFDTSISSSLGKMVSACVSDFDTDIKLKEVEEFYNNHIGQIGSAKREIEIAIQTVKANIAWMNRSYKDVVSWLEKKTIKQSEK